MCRLESMVRTLEMVFILLFIFLSPSSKKVVPCCETHYYRGETKFFRRHHPQVLQAHRLILQHYKT